MKLSVYVCLKLYFCLVEMHCNLRTIYFYTEFICYTPETAVCQEITKITRAF